MVKGDVEIAHTSLGSKIAVDVEQMSPRSKLGKLIQDGQRRMSGGESPK